MIEVFNGVSGENPRVKYIREEPNAFLSSIGAVTDDLLFRMESE
jgi:hypothetical protein